MLLNCGVGEDSWESLGLQGDPTSPSQRRLVLGVHWRDWCWSWNSNTLAIWCGELSHLKISWCWERLRAGGEGDDRGWDGWMASPTQWTWVWVDFGSWWLIGRPGCGSWGHKELDTTEWLNWTELLFFKYAFPLWFIMRYWIYFPVLYGRTLFIHSIHKSLHLLTPTFYSISSVTLKKGKKVFLPSEPPGKPLAIKYFWIKASILF